MPLLADQQIKILCRTPKFMVTEKVNTVINNLEETSEETNQSTILIPFYIDEKHVIIEVNNNPNFLSYREATDQEKMLIDKPMIFPFVNDLVCTKSRIITEEENKQYLISKPFNGKVVKNENDEFVFMESIIPYGLTSYGYNVRLADEFSVFNTCFNTNQEELLIDPFNFELRNFTHHKGDYCIIPPNGYVTCKTIEQFIIPRDISVTCSNLPTYVDVGANIVASPIEAGYEGHMYFGISNCTSIPMKIYAGMGISQLMFHKGNKQCEVSYMDKNKRLS